ncbi:MAG: OB-fold nucleic acid binding domain-containing protein, partial [Planctomycetota bacterium]
MTKPQTFSVRRARTAAALDDAQGPITVKGWVRTRRDSKEGLSFIEVNDGTCQGNLQIVAKSELANYESEIQKLTA